MTDHTPKFDPIPRLQQIAATIEESGADTFDAPATAVHYIECAIKEIEWLRDEMEKLRKEGFHLAANQCHAGYGGEYGHHRCAEIDTLNQKLASIFNEIDCRIEHGAESNGHLEAIRSLFKET